MRMFARFPAAVAVLVAAVPLAASPLRAQDTTLVSTLIERVVGDVSSLRYREAIASGREILNARLGLTVEQEVLLRSAMGAAFYPDVEGDPQPDSALAQFTRVIQLQPDATLPLTLVWDGLDSLFRVARARTFAVVLRPPASRLALAGSTPVELPVVASRPAHFHLRTRATGQAAVIEHSMSNGASAAATLTLRAHDGARILLGTGPHDLIVVATDPATGDSTVLVRPIEVEGNAPSLQPIPVLDSTQLQPERREPRQVRTALTGAAFATASIILANGLRADEPIKSTFTPDARASLVSVGIIAATLGAMWMDRDGVDEEAVQFNAALRGTHERLVEANAKTNRERLTNYRPTLVFLGEGR